MWTRRPEKRGRNDALFEAAAGEPGDASADCLVLEDFDAQLMRPELGARDPDRMAKEGGEEGRIHDESADAGGYLQSFELYETQSVRKKISDWKFMFSSSSVSCLNVSSNLLFLLFLLMAWVSKDANFCVLIYFLYNLST